MILNLDNLTKIGAFTGAPVEREITWKQGDEEISATVFVRRLSYKSTVNDVRFWNSDGNTLAGRISACICDQDGKPIFAPEDITGESDPQRGPLDGNLTLALLTVIAEVIGFSGKQES